jgi:hypothetical protein
VSAVPRPRFAASAPIAIVDVWTGNDPGRVRLFPGLQLLLFLTVPAVLVDLSTIRAWEGTQLSMAANWSTLLKAYNFEGTRKVLLYAAPAAAAVIAIGQQMISGTGLEFINSLLQRLKGRGLFLRWFRFEIESDLGEESLDWGGLVQNSPEPTADGGGFRTTFRSLG